jgi:hypothetical protein
MSKPGLDRRHRNMDGEISGKHGNAHMKAILHTLLPSSSLPFALRSA